MEDESLMETQTWNRKVAIFSRSLELMNTAAGIWIQKIPASYLKKLMAPDANKKDPVVRALQSLDTIFTSCRKKKVDMESSVKYIMKEHSNDSRGHGAVLLAWRMSFEGNKMKAPDLVGMCTLFNFISSYSFGTEENDMEEQDFRVLSRYFGNNNTYIDTMCSTQKGVGRLLVLHAYKFALSRKKKGLIALAYSARANGVPESKRIFEKLRFSTIIDDAHNHGTWFYKSTDAVDLAGVAEESVKVCTRRAFTNADSLIWRCPN